MKVAYCRIYCLDKFSNKILFKVLKTEETPVSTPYSMIEFKQYTPDCKLYLTNHDINLYTNKFYLIDKEFYIVNYIWCNNGKYFEVIPVEYNSYLKDMEKPPYDYMLCEFIKAGIELVFGERLNKILSNQVPSNENISFNVDTTDNELFSILGTNKPMTNLGIYTYTGKFISIMDDGGSLLYINYPNGNLISISSFINTIDYKCNKYANNNSQYERSFNYENQK